VSQEKVVFRFPTVCKDKNSIVILKNTKTPKSDRYVYITDPLKQELQKRHQYIESLKDSNSLFADHNLVFCLNNGRPITPALYEKWFKKWLLTYPDEFPSITFHGLRHSSITYLMELAGGNLQAVQDNSGHATATILLNTYNHVRKGLKHELMINFERDFYDLHEKTALAEPLCLYDLIANDSIIQMRIKELMQLSY